MVYGGVWRYIEVKGGVQWRNMVYGGVIWCRLVTGGDGRWCMVMSDRVH